MCLQQKKIPKYYESIKEKKKKKKTQDPLNETNLQTEHKYFNGFTGLVQLDVKFNCGNCFLILYVYYFCSA